MGAVVVIGAGPGIGRAVARRFAATGRPVGVAARSRTTVDGVLADLDTPKAGVLADVADEAGLRGALGDLVDRLGVPEVVVYNAGVIRTDRVTDLDARTVADTYAVNVGGAVTAAAFLLPRMADLGGGSFLATAGMPTPLPTLTTLSLGKAGLRPGGARHRLRPGRHCRGVSPVARDAGDAAAPRCSLRRSRRRGRMTPGRFPSYPRFRRTPTSTGGRDGDRHRRMAARGCICGRSDSRTAVRGQLSGAGSGAHPRRRVLLAPFICRACRVR